MKLPKVKVTNFAELNPCCLENLKRISLEKLKEFKDAGTTKEECRGKGFSQIFINENYDKL